MRSLALALLALVAAGCSIHVVEQPATPMVVAAPHPAPVYRAEPRPVFEQYVAPAPTPRPRVVVVRRPHAKPPARRPTLVPFKTVAPEPRNTKPARIARRSPPRKPVHVRVPNPPKRVLLTGVAKAQ